VLPTPWASGCGGRWPRREGQGAGMGVAYKVFVTYSFNVHAAIKEGVC
jgi:hypothetical protein